MMSRKIAALAAGALLLASTTATAQTTGSGASALSLAGAMQSSADDTGGDGWNGTTVALIAGVLFAIVIVAVVTGSDSEFDRPSSP